MSNYHNEERYCKYCGALLNIQQGFSDYQLIWQCEKCGEVNRTRGGAPVY